MRRLSLGLNFTIEGIAPTMTIKKYSGQDLHVGQWVNLETAVRVGFAGNPAKILELKPQSIVVEPVRRTLSGGVDVEQKRIYRLKSISFVCDTFDEAEAVRNASREFVDREMKAERAAQEQANIRRLEAIAAALKE